MAVVIRLQRTGKPRQGYYRVVAIEKSRGPRGKPLEVLGTYDPRGPKPRDKARLDVERLQRWLRCGAKPSETVASLLRTSGARAPAAA